jgi:2-dehydropantoate 2-reductase
MKVCIVGAGAIGSLVGAAFARGGHQVSLIAHGAHLQALRDGGLVLERLDGGEERHAFAAGEDPAEHGPQDLLVIALKAYSVAAMLPRLGPLLAPDTAVMPAMNGLPWWYFYRLAGPFRDLRIECLDPDGGMRAALDPARIIGCVVHAAGEVVRPGRVRHTSGRLYYVGELDGSDTERLQAICQALAAGGCDARGTARIRQEVWTKLIGNLSFNPVAALTLARMNEIGGNPALIAVIRTMMEEGMQVARHYGEPVEMTIERRLEVARAIGTSKISMHQDLERRRPLELAAIVGSVVELARKAAIPTPAIDTVYALIAERARHL